LLVTFCRVGGGRAVEKQKHMLILLFTYTVDALSGITFGYSGLIMALWIRASDHTVYAPGIYSNFRNDPVVISTAIQHPIEPNIRFLNAFPVKLDNLGGIRSIVNNEGTRPFEKGRSVRRIGEGHFVKKI
jgi:hypothetical protein